MRLMDIWILKAQELNSYDAEVPMGFLTNNAHEESQKHFDGSLPWSKFIRKLIFFLKRDFAHFVALLDSIEVVHIENEICFAFDRVQGQTGHSEKFYQEKCDELVAAKNLFKEKNNSQEFISHIHHIITHFRKKKLFYKKREERKQNFKDHHDLQKFQIKNF